MKIPRTLALCSLLLTTSGLARAQTFAVSVPPQALPPGDTYASWGGRAAGDITGDGVDDIIFPFQRDATPNVYPIIVGVIDGATSQLIPGREHMQPNYPNPTSWGNSICVIGDLNGDGSSEYAVADRIGNRVRVFMGGGALNLYDHIACEITSSQMGGSEKRFGQAIAAAGDINGDGIPDLLISDSRIKYGASGGASLGAVYIMSGSEILAEWADREKKVLNGLSIPPDFPTLSVDNHIGIIKQNRELTGVQYLGKALAGGLDANGDNTPDILITAEQIDWIPGAQPEYTLMLQYSVPQAAREAA